MIEIKQAAKTYRLAKDKLLNAVDHISLTIEKGEIFGLVGESGSGKSTLGKMLLGLIPPTSGEIYFNNQQIVRPLPRKIQMIFQDPYSSLNPRMNVHSILSEPTTIHKLPNRVDELLDLVGLPRQAKWRYPHEFSGGQRQRIGIARALALNPEFLICDEPISALDVSIQAQIVNLLLRLQKELNLTILFIAHDLSMIRYLSTRMAVMHQGKIVETGETDAIFSQPRHPFTQILLSSIPVYSFQTRGRQSNLLKLHQPLLGASHKE